MELKITPYSELNRLALKQASRNNYRTADLTRAFRVISAHKITFPNNPNLNNINTVYNNLQIMMTKDKKYIYPQLGNGDKGLFMAVRIHNIEKLGDYVISLFSNLAQKGKDGKYNIVKLAEMNDLTITQFKIPATASARKPVSALLLNPKVKRIAQMMRYM